MLLCYDFRLLEILGLLTEMWFPQDGESESYLHGDYITIVATLTTGSGERISYNLPAYSSNDTVPLDITLSVMDPGKSHAAMI